MRGEVMTISPLLQPAAIAMGDGGNSAMDGGIAAQSR
jgi:hypothetical protein